MKQTAENRELFVLTGSYGPVHGTMHKPVRHVDSRWESTAIVIPNGLSTPRSGYSDAAVEWANSLAEAGYPTFRVDLPSLGDSHGPLQLELLAYITAGGYGAEIRQVLRQLAEQYPVKSFVIAGHCAGGVTGLYAASEADLCRGLILLDPYFNYPKRLSPKVPPSLLLWSRQSSIGALIRHAYDGAREMTRRLHSDGLPNSANRRLLQQWRQVASRGIPILVLKSPKTDLQPGQFDYMRYATELAGPKSRVEVCAIEGTDHSFADSVGRRAVHFYSERWLKKHFPHQHVGSVESVCGIATLERC